MRMSGEDEQGGNGHRRAGEWEKLHPFEAQRTDVERMLVGVEVMPSREDVLDGFNFLPAVT